MPAARVPTLIRTAVVLVAAVIASVMLVSVFWPRQPDANRRPQWDFDGASELLQQTTILPTLDSSLVENKSAIWCSSVQLAWNRLKDDFLQEPIQLRNGQDIADRLNNAPQSEADIAPSAFLAMVGKVEDGIREEIQTALATKFPGSTIPAMEPVPDSVVAFGYVNANVRYEYQFVDSPEWLSFRQGDGRNVRVRAFGLPKLDNEKPVLGGRRDQVRVLFRDGNEFAVDLSRESMPNQIVLAKIPRKDTLAESLAELTAKLRRAKSFSLPDSATLLVPNMNWRMVHNFRELEGPDNEFLNPVLRSHFLVSFFQFVDFTMDRIGSSVESGADIVVYLNGHEHKENASPDHYHFDEPFLIVMQKRGAEHPFFTMWVDNAELLCRR